MKTYLTIILLLIAYLLGSIPNGLWIGKIFFHKDVREYGSHNIGATNVTRTLGGKAGIAVMILDIAKGSIATLLPSITHDIIYNYQISMLLFGIFAIIGHSFSIFNHFHGGKAVSTTAGMIMIYNCPLFLYCCSSMLLITYLTSMVSAASLFSFTTGTLIVIFYFQDPYLTPLAVLLTIFVFYKHRYNIVRMLHHKENMMHFGLGYRHSLKRK